MNLPAASLLALALASALPARADDPPLDLQLDLPAALGITGAALGASLASALLKGDLAPQRCRICATDGFDATIRNALRWRNTAAAANDSDLLMVGVPLLAGGALVLSGWQAGGARTAGEDLLVAAEAVSIAVLATQVAKFSFGRIRPYAWASPSAVHGPDAFLSEWSGHTSATFAAAAAAGTVARLRGYRSWPWILGLGLAGAATCGWLRIAADRHWATDVLAGAAVGSLAGFGLPVWLHGRRDAAETGAAGVRLQPYPFGVAGTFD